MEVIVDIEKCSVAASVVTTGNFDGVHKGHRFLLEKLVLEANDRNVPAVVVMFSPHPRQVLAGGDDNFFYLTEEKEQEDLLAECGIDFLLKVPFDKAMAAWSAEDFITRILLDKLGMTYYLIGYDHRLGNPKYNNDILPLSIKYGFDLEQGEVYFEGQRTVSSTAVRQALGGGDVSLASRLLGRDYGFKCSVVSGKRIGRTIGYPTANLKPHFDKILIPSEGVYAVRVKYQENIYGGMMQVGHRPTLDDKRGLTLEVHIFDFSQDIYHQEVELFFVQYLRAIERFDGLDALVSQLQKDEKQARYILLK